MRAGPNGTIIGRPKKPPIIGSEKTDGKFLSFDLKFRGWNEDIHLPCARVRKDILRFFIFEKAFDDPWREIGKKFCLINSNF